MFKYFFHFLFLTLTFNLYSQPSAYSHKAGMNYWTQVDMTPLGLGTTQTRTIRSAVTNNEF